MKNVSSTLLALALLASMVGASGAFAQSKPSTNQPAKVDAPAAAPEKMQDMMQGGNMMGMMDMMTQMNEMMTACTKMMTANAEPRHDEQPNKG